MPPTVVTDFPRRVRTIEQTWITLRDGTRLSARIWLPEDAEQDPVPAIFELLPYRLNDGTAPRDSRHFPYLAGHGYACVRVDQRGTGESDGVMLDEYLPQEQADGCEVIEWIAAQPWCTGAVGMVGISWSGFNSLQIAAHRPPALKAIVTLCSTDDRYADDVHYDGGCVSSDMAQWAASMFMWNARPPDPAIVGERWRDMWIERMEGAPSFIDPWMTHQRRDDYWKQGSVCEDFSRIEAAVYAVGGWADGYTNAIPRMLEGLPGPRKGLIGPWAHAWPQAGPPEPTIGFLQEVIRWFDHWLKGEQNGIMDEPMLRAWIQEPLPPRTCYTEIPGRWIAERCVAAGRRVRAGAAPDRRRRPRGSARPRAADRLQRPPGRRPRRRLVVPVRRGRGLAGRPARHGRHVPVLRVGAARPGHRDPRLHRRAPGARRPTGPTP